MKTIFDFLEYFTNSNKKGRLFVYWIFSPIFYALELIVYLWFWKKIIIPEILTNDKIVEFLKINEFVYLKDKFVKEDLLETNEFYASMELDEARILIRKEFVLALSEILSKNSALDIENYISLLVVAEVQAVKDQEEIIRAKVFIVTLQFCRLVFLKKAKRNLIWLTIIYGILGMSIFSVIKFIL